MLRINTAGAWLQSTRKKERLLLRKVSYPKGTRPFWGKRYISFATRLKRRHKHIAQRSTQQLTRSSSTKFPLRCANRILAPCQLYPCTASVVLFCRTSRTMVPCQLYPCILPVVPLNRTSRTVLPYQSCRCTVPVVPLHRASCTVVPCRHPCQWHRCTVPVVPLCRTSYVPLYRTATYLNAETLQQPYVTALLKLC